MALLRDHGGKPKTDRWSLLFSKFTCTNCVKKERKFWLRHATRTYEQTNRFGIKSNICARSPSQELSPASIWTGVGLSGRPTGKSDTLKGKKPISCPDVLFRLVLTTLGAVVTGTGTIWTRLRETQQETCFYKGSKLIVFFQITAVLCMWSVLTEPVITSLCASLTVHLEKWKCAWKYKIPHFECRRRGTCK